MSNTIYKIDHNVELDWTWLLRYSSLKLVRLLPNRVPGLISNIWILELVPEYSSLRTNIFLLARFRKTGNSNLTPARVLELNGSFTKSLYYEYPNYLGTRARIRVREFVLYKCPSSKISFFYSTNVHIIDMMVYRLITGLFIIQIGSTEKISNH